MGEDEVFFNHFLPLSFLNCWHWTFSRHTAALYRNTLILLIWLWIDWSSQRRLVWCLCSARAKLILSFWIASWMLLETLVVNIITETSGRRCRLRISSWISFIITPLCTSIARGNVNDIHASPDILILKQRYLLINTRIH